LLFRIEVGVQPDFGPELNRLERQFETGAHAGLKTPTPPVPGETRRALETPAPGRVFLPLARRKEGVAVKEQPLHSGVGR
jgi:hypothetical protein